MKVQEIKIDEHPGFEPLDITEAFQDLMCPVCQEVCNDAIIPPCGHQHCRACAEGVLASNKKKCPTCRAVWIREEWESLAEPRHLALKKCYEKLQVKCHGCKQLVLRGFDGALFKQHAQECQINCPCCKAISNRATIAKHLDECPNIRLSCEAEDVGCDKWFARMVMADHEKNCPLKLVAPTIRQQQAHIKRLSEETLALAAHNRDLVKHMAKLQMEFKSLTKAVELLAEQQKPVVQPVPVTKAPAAPKPSPIPKVGPKT